MRIGAGVRGIRRNQFSEFRRCEDVVVHLNLQKSTDADHGWARAAHQVFISDHMVTIAILIAASRRKLDGYRPEVTDACESTVAFERAFAAPAQPRSRNVPWITDDVEIARSLPEYPFIESNEPFIR